MSPAGRNTFHAVHLLNCEDLRLAVEIAERFKRENPPGSHAISKNRGVVYTTPSKVKLIAWYTDASCRNISVEQL